LCAAFMTHFVKVVLFTDSDGRARFREERLALGQGSPQSMLSDVFACGGYQLRVSPVGFQSTFHCTGAPQWCFILGGQMEIGLQGGVSRLFGRVSTSTVPMFCLREQHSIRRCTATGAARWALTS
jgi:hypothetical protein